MSSDSVKIAEILNYHFINAGGSFPRNNCQPSSQATSQTPTITPLPTSLNGLTHTTQEEVLEIIQGLNPHKSSGPSRITSACLQATISAISQSYSTSNQWCCPNYLEDGRCHTGLQER